MYKDNIDLFYKYCDGYGSICPNLFKGVKKMIFLR